MKRTISSAKTLQGKSRVLACAIAATVCALMACMAFALSGCKPPQGQLAANAALAEMSAIQQKNPESISYLPEVSQAKELEQIGISQEEFFAQVNKIGLSVIGQSEGIAIADKKMYALRDVTATVSCIPLIASSIMSKKLASGSDAILLDVTTGTGAFMKTVEQSIELAKLMVSIGTHHGRRVAAMITDMDTPLGHNIGNSLEVMESMDVLKGHGPADLTEVCLQLAANMLVLADKGSPAECRAMAEAVIADGSAFAKCKEMFAAQGGDTRVLDDYSLFEKPAASYELLAEEDGYIVANDAEKIGSASVLLGAGRQKKGDPLDFAAGITLHKKRGDYVHKGESLATFYGAADKFDAAAAEFRSGLVYGPEKPEEAPLVYALVTKDGVERY